jgi:hypothetical protein
MNKKKEEPPDEEREEVRSILLYERRLLSLEDDFNKAYEKARKLCDKILDDESSPGKEPNKIRLDAIKELISLTCERADFYLKLGAKYDVMRFHAEFLDELSKRDSMLFEDISAELARRARRIITEKIEKAEK